MTNTGEAAAGVKEADRGDKSDGGEEIADSDVSSASALSAPALADGGTGVGVRAATLGTGMATGAAESAASSASALSAPTLADGGTGAGESTGAASIGARAGVGAATLGTGVGRGAAGNRPA